MIIDSLGSEFADQRTLSARTLGELVRKLGERVLGDILPILEQSLQTGDEDRRQGVCIGLCEILRSTTREYIELFVSNIIPCIRTGLCDNAPQVREAAANAFSILHSAIGHQAVDGILPHMLIALENPATTEEALSGLRELVTYKGNVILALLMPSLLVKRMSAFQAHALSSLISVGGPAVTKYVSQILSTLMDNLQDEKNTAFAEIKDAAVALVHSINDEEGVVEFINELIKSTKHSSSRVRLVAIELLRELCDHSEADFSVYLPQIAECFARRFIDEATDVVSVAWGGLNSVISTRVKQDKVTFARMLRRVMGEIAATVPNQYIKGLGLDRGATPFYDLYVDMLANSPDNESKLLAAEAYAELVRFIDPSAHGGAYIVKLAGPLLNNVQKYPSVLVREAVIGAIVAFLERFADKLKAMNVQIQSVFIKGLQDKASSRALRDYCAQGLGMLAKTGKTDKLVKELCDELKAPAIGQHEACLKALDGVAKLSGSALPDALKISITQVCSAFLHVEEEPNRILSARTISRCLATLTDVEFFKATIETNVLGAASTVVNAWQQEHGRCSLLREVLRRAPSQLLSSCDPVRIIAETMRQLRSDNALVASSAGVAAAHLVEHAERSGQIEMVLKTIQLLGTVLRDAVGNEVPVETLQAFKLAFKRIAEPSDALLAAFCPLLMMVVRAKAGPARLVCAASCCVPCVPDVLMGISPSSGQLFDCLSRSFC
jgi:hypothetical protein